MTKTAHYKGHRWTTPEVKALMDLWSRGEPLDVISAALHVTTAALLKMVNRLRKNGIPLNRRRKGHKAGRSNKSWTQGEVEYLVRRRAEKATSEEIANELERTWVAVCAMIGKLRSENVPIAMRGNGVRRLWSAQEAMAVAMQHDEHEIIELNAGIQGGGL